MTESDYLTDADELLLDDTDPFRLVYLLNEDFFEGGLTDEGFRSDLQGSTPVAPGHCPVQSMRTLTSRSPRAASPRGLHPLASTPVTAGNIVNALDLWP